MSIQRARVLLRVPTSAFHVSGVVMKGGVRVGVDVGGTFTDLVALAPDGRMNLGKVLSTPTDPSIGLFQAIDEWRSGGKQPAPGIAVLVLGTTIATNALLERTGAKVVLVTTAGFEDLLWLRRQDRAALYDLTRDHPSPLIDRSQVIGVRERMGPRGPILSLTEREVARVVRAVGARRPDAVAIALLFGFLHSDHETRLARALRKALPDISVAPSSEVLPVIREYERTSTTVAEAYLRPLVASALTSAAEAARERSIVELRVMTSAGGTITPQTAATRSASLALSGPVGGVVGARLVGEAVGLRDLLTLDMGGTSADASLVTGGVALAEGSAVVGGIPLGLPAILLETVSAGGGSIATIDEGGALKVGPASAGAVPGPACYGRGGTVPTVTDACLVLGWLSEDQLLADRVRLDRGAAERALGRLGKTLRRDARHVAAGIIEVASAVMARALKRVSVARGADPRDMALLPFGGAGPLFGCALGEALGMDAIVVPPHPGVLSALGLAAASEREDFVAAFHRPVHELSNGKLETGFRPLLARAAAALPGAAVVCAADCRFAGQGYEITVNADYTDPAALHQAFLTAHARRHGHADPALEVEVVNLRVTAMRVGPSRVPLAAPPAAASPTRRSITLRASPVVEVTADVWPLGALPAGLEIRGPAVLMGPDATGIVEPGWTGRVHDSGAIIVRRSRA